MQMKIFKATNTLSDTVYTRNLRQTEGKTEGRVEEKKDIARNLKQIGLDVSKIAQVTGLSIEEIEQL